MFVTPANHIAGTELPPDWFDAKMNPRSFEVRFDHGTAEVSAELGRYMVAQGLAHKTRLVLPGFFNGGS